eukprot:10333020-Lingulodinium_polyedra.AAC.1
MAAAVRVMALTAATVRPPEACSNLCILGKSSCPDSSPLVLMAASPLPKSFSGSCGLAGVATANWPNL